MGSLSAYIKMIKTEQKSFSGLSIFGLLKYYKAWSSSVREKSSNLSELPWMTFSVIDFLSSISNPTMKVFEYGSGSSTLFWAKRVAEVVSVEHDSLWKTNVQDQLNAQNITNVHLFIVAPQKGELTIDADPSDPYLYLSDDASYQGFSFENYVKKINDYADSYFDIVVVDGRARPSCIAAALKKVKSDGYLVVDNAERTYYFSKTNPLLPNSLWKKSDFIGPVPGLRHFHQTSVFKKN